MVSRTQHAWRGEELRSSDNPRIKFKLCRRRHAQTDQFAARPLEVAGFSYLGEAFDSDQRSVQRISVASLAAQVVIEARQPFSIDWTTQDNSVVTLDGEADDRHPGSTGQLCAGAAQLRQGA